MYDISHDRPVPDSHSSRNGITKRLRGMYKNDSFEMPSDKKASAYSAARLTGARITVRDMGAGTAIVWRLDGPPRPASIFDDEIDTFGQHIHPEIFK